MITVSQLVVSCTVCFFFALAFGYLFGASQERARNRKDMRVFYTPKARVISHCQWMSRDFPVFSDYIDWEMFMNDYEDTRPGIREFRESMKRKYTGITQYTDTMQEAK